MLTLSAWVYSSVKGEVGNGGKHGGGRRPVAGKTTTIAAILSPRAQLPGGGGRGRRGGAPGPLRYVQGGFNRRRRAAAAWSAHGHGAGRRLGFCTGGKRGGRRSRWSRAPFLSSRGGQGGEEEATAAREPRRQAAAVIPLSPQLKKALTVGTHCQGFNLFPFPFYFQ